MLRNKNQNSQLYALLNKLGIDTETRQEIVSTYTQGRTSSSSKMSVTECQAMINDLRQRSPNDTAADQMRKKIISLFIKQGYTLPNGKADMDAINIWTNKYGHQHKNLNNYQYNELPKLVSQAEQMYFTFLKTMSK